MKQLSFTIGMKVAGLFLVTLFLNSTSSLAQSDLCDVRWYDSAYNSGSSRYISNAISNGANVNQYCSSGELSPLLLALEYDSDDVALALIRAGANLYHDPSSYYNHRTLTMYSGPRPIDVIDYRCEIGSIDQRICNEIKHLEAIDVAHNNLCDPSYWQSFSLQSRSQITNRLQAVMRMPGLDVNHYCGSGNRPLHIAIKSALHPHHPLMTEGVGFAINIFLNEGDHHFTGNDVYQLLFRLLSEHQRLSRSLN